MQFKETIVITKKQNNVLLRMIDKHEAQNLLYAMVEIAEDSPYILMTADNFKTTGVEDEMEWIESYNNDPRSILILAEFNGKIVGILDFKSYQNPKTCHRGNLGISLHHSLRGEGLGEELLNKFLKEVKAIDGLKAVELSVMGDNEQAYHLYRKMGFREIGRNPNAFKLRDGTFSSDILMGLELQ